MMKVAVAHVHTMIKEKQALKQEILQIRQALGERYHLRLEHTDCKLNAYNSTTLSENDSSDEEPMAFGRGKAKAHKLAASRNAAKYAQIQ